jgi:hypothetical protein
METTQAAPRQALKPNQAFINGKCDNYRTFERNGATVHEHRVKQAAPDEFTSPGAVLVQSSQKLAAVGEYLQTVVNVTGFAKSFQDRSGARVQSADMVLQAVS